MLVYKDCDFLTEEVLGLERESSGKIEHPENGKYGSKDTIDAVTGALYNASQHADEFAYEFGEDYHKETLEVNMTEDDMRKQLTVNFEEELKKTLMGNYLKREDDKQTPQSNGLLKYGNPYEAQEVQTNLNNIKNGILVW